jgi:hypothetical protein
MPPSPTLSRLESQWVYGGTLAAFLLLALAPLISRTLGCDMMLLFLPLPIYMLHQLEEHDGDRFRQFANEVIGKGHEVLSHRAVFVINIGGVWVFSMACFLAAVQWGQGWGLGAVYLPLVNALAHIQQAVLLRRYNPGLVTAIVLFLPLTLLILLTVGRHIEWPYHALGLFLAIAIHIGIVAHVKLQLARLKKTA